MLGDIWLLLLPHKQTPHPSGDSARRSPFWMLWLPRLPSKQKLSAPSTARRGMLWCHVVWCRNLVTGCRWYGVMWCDVDLWCDVVSSGQMSVRHVMWCCQFLSGVRGMLATGWQWYDVMSCVGVRGMLVIWWHMDAYGVISRSVGDRMSMIFDVMLCDDQHSTRYSFQWILWRPPIWTAGWDVAVHSFDFIKLWLSIDC